MRVLARLRGVTIRDLGVQLDRPRDGLELGIELGHTVSEYIQIKIMSDCFPDFLPAGLTKDQAKAILDEPPAPDSPKDREDLSEVLRLQGERTDADCTRANTEVKITLASLFGAPYGPLNDQQIRLWNPFFEQIFKDTNFFVNQAKHLWNRDRPFVQHSDVHPCVPKEPSSS